MGSSSPNSVLPRLSDAEVDRLWLQGDQGVLGEIHRRYRVRLEAVAFRVLKNRADAEDVVQRVFLALPRAAYNGTATLSSYLYRAAMNGAVNVLRSRKRQERLESDVVSRSLVGDGDAGDSPEAQVLEGEVLSAVARALMHVKPQHRRVLVLRIVWGLSNTEIAKREGLPVATVGTWLRRGREELRAALRPVLRDLEGEDA